jgi:serine/threonine protein kinase
VVAYTLIRGKLPFCAESKEELYRNIVNSNPYFDKTFSKNSKDLIGSLLSKKPSDRPLASQVLTTTSGGDSCSVSGFIFLSNYSNLLVFNLPTNLLLLNKLCCTMFNWTGGSFSSCREPNKKVDFSGLVKKPGFPIIAFLMNRF